MMARSGMLSHESDPVPLLRSSCALWTQRGTVTVPIRARNEPSRSFHNYREGPYKGCKENFLVYLLRVNALLAQCFNSVLNVKVLVDAFNQEKALVGASSVMVKSSIDNLRKGSFEALVTMTGLQTEA